MDNSYHSVRAYLERLPIGKLLKALDDYSAAEKVTVMPEALEDVLAFLKEKNPLYGWRLTPYIEDVEVLIQRAREYAQELAEQTDECE